MSGSERGQHEEEGNPDIPHLSKAHTAKWSKVEHDDMYGAQHSGHVERHDELWWCEIGRLGRRYERRLLDGCAAERGSRAFLDSSLHALSFAIHAWAGSTAHEFRSDIMVLPN
jgi:hypothetical protein